MKRKFIAAVTIAIITLVSCNSDPSLQKYFVEHSNDTDFLVLDISPNILNLDKTKLSADQNKALQSFEKVNILAFKATDKNKLQFETEKGKINTLLKNKKYQQLMKVGSGKEGVSISFVGTEDNINEFIVFVNKKENGFAVVRIIGDRMNSNNIMTLLSVVKESNLNLDQLKPLEGYFK